MTAIDLDALAILAELASKVYPLKLEPVDDGNDYFTCPICDGSGDVDPPAEYTTNCVWPTGIQVYGIGDPHVDLGAYITALSPPVVLALLSRLRAAEAVVERSRSFLHAIKDERPAVNKAGFLECALAAYDDARKGEG